MERDIWTYFHGMGSSVAPDEAQTVLSSIGIAAFDGKYDQSTAALFEQTNDPKLPPVSRLRVSVLLGLVSPAAVASALGITSDKAISTFTLKPILDIVATGPHAP